MRYFLYLPCGLHVWIEEAIVTHFRPHVWTKEAILPSLNSQILGLSTYSKGSQNTPTLGHGCPGGLDFCGCTTHFACHMYHPPRGLRPWAL